MVACNKGTTAHKYAWERRLTEAERELVASVDRRAWLVARWVTPSKYRRNAIAVERSYEMVMRNVLRSAAKYDPTQGKFETYCLPIAGKAARSMWARQSKAFIATLNIPQEFPKNEFESALEGVASSDAREPVEIVAERELIEKAIYALKVFRPRWHALVRFRFGLDGTAYGAVESARMCGFQESRGSMAYGKALVFLRTYIEGLR